MADEMYAVNGETLTGIANAIRSKTGSDDFMTVSSMASAIEGISGGGVVVKKAAVEGEITPNKYLSGVDGVEISYNNWAISPYYILDGNYFACNSFDLRYSTFYNADKQPIGIIPMSFMKRPANVKYLRYSDDENIVSKFTVINFIGNIIEED